MFIVVAVLGAFFAYHANFVRERREAREWLRLQNAGVFDGPPGEGTLHGATVYHPATRRFPVAIRILREAPVGVIDLPPMPKSDAARMRRLFPEATVHVGIEGFYSPLNSTSL